MEHARAPALTLKPLELDETCSGRAPELTALALWSTCTPASTLFLALGDKAGGVEVLELRRPSVAQGPQGGASHAGAHCKFFSCDGWLAVTSAGAAGWCIACRCALQVFQLRWVARCELPSQQCEKGPGSAVCVHHPYRMMYIGGLGQC